MNTKESQEEPLTCWKLLTVLPILFPTSGNFLGPKTKAATPAITTSSGTPRPNKALQVRPFLALWLPLVVLPRTRELQDLVLLKKAVVLKKVELEEEKGRERGGFGRDRVTDEISMFISICLSGTCGFWGDFWFTGFEEKGMITRWWWWWWWWWCGGGDWVFLDYFFYLVFLVFCFCGF